MLVRGYRLQPPLLMLDGEPHRRQRQPYADGFSADRMTGIDEYLWRSATDLVDAFTRAGDSADLVADYASRPGATNSTMPSPMENQPSARASRSAAVRELGPF